MDYQGVFGIFAILISMLDLSAQEAPSFFYIREYRVTGSKLLSNAEVGRLKTFGLPLLVGASRKRFIGTLTGVDKADERIHGSVAAALALYNFI